MKNIIFIAPQAAGKGTQASLVKEKYGIPHISMGDLLRDARKDGSERAKTIQDYIDKGNLVPESIVNEIIEERLNQSDCKNGFILDGYPRNMDQANSLDSFLEKQNRQINYVLNLDVPREEVLKRIGGRRVCSKCGENYNINVPSQAPKTEGICTKCGSELIQRSDDYEEAINQRLNIYYTQTEPLLDLYSKKKTLYKIDGTDTPNKVFEVIEAILND